MVAVNPKWMALVQGKELIQRIEAEWSRGVSWNSESIQFALSCGIFTSLQLGAVVVLGGVCLF